MLGIFPKGIFPRATSQELGSCHLGKYLWETPLGKNLQSLKLPSETWMLLATPHISDMILATPHISDLILATPHISDLILATPHISDLI